MRKMLVPREFSNIPDRWHFAPIVDTGDFVFFSGITGVHPDGSVSDDPDTQLRDTFRFGLPSRNGNLRTLAAVHNEINQALAQPAALHIKSALGPNPIAKKSIVCRVLAYVMIRILT
jgi:enamine deaminase RidA (YjgF/YER057c/UK114 family)